MGDNLNLTYEEQICKAIEVLLNKGLSGVQFDRTIQAVVVDIVDIEKGQYKVQYQDSIFNARAACPGIEYPKGTKVYILVPFDDYSNEKIILWSGQGISHFGPLPITSMTIHSNDHYEVTTRKGVETYQALYEEIEEDTSNGS